MSVPEYRLRMDNHDLAWFLKHPGTNRWFPVELQTEHERCQGWIGYRGRSSRWFRKPSFELCFQRPGFSGHDRLHLNAGYRDPSLLRARLCLDLFAQMGVPTPKAWHATLSLNGKRFGLYTTVESVDQSWLSRNGYADGPIYYAVGNHGTLGYVDQETGRRKRYLAKGYESAQPGEDSFADLESLVHSVVLPDEGAFDKLIASIVDVDCFLRWFIGVEFLAHTDGLVQNYALFRPRGGRWLISPWDCDATLGRLPCGQPQEGDEMRLGTGTENYLAVRLLASREWRPVYHALWERLLADELSLPRITERLDEIFAEIRSEGLHDKRRKWSDTVFLRQPNEIRHWVSDRTKRIQEMLVATA